MAPSEPAARDCARTPRHKGRPRMPPRAAAAMRAGEGGIAGRGLPAGRARLPPCPGRCAARAGPCGTGRPAQRQHPGMRRDRAAPPQRLVEDEGRETRGGGP